MKRIKGFLSFHHLMLILIVATVAGCATIMSGKTQEVMITSTPSDANVIIERSVAGTAQTSFSGVTPVTAELRRKYEYLLTVEMDGYEPATTTLENGSNGWIWGNLLFGGVIGLIVDFSNGAAKKLEPNEIHVDLVSVSSAGYGSSTDLYAVFKFKDDKGNVSVSPVKMVPSSD